MSFKSFIVEKTEKVKTLDPGDCSGLHIIDVNLWFKSNNLTPSSMNDIRQYIFEEWLHKKIYSSKTKITSGFNLVIVYDNPTDLFINLLKQKIHEVLECDFCDIVLME